MVKCLFFKQFTSRRELSHFVATRRGGVSTSPYDSLNLSFAVGDQPERVLENRNRLAQAIAIPHEAFVYITQIHGNHVLTVSPGMRGTLGEADAMVTDVVGICLTILVADCVPLLFFDPVKRVIGVAHAGWRGTVQRIAEKTVETLQHNWGVDPATLWVGVGSSIGPCCYEVGGAVITSVSCELTAMQTSVLRQHGAKTYFDLWEANRTQLLGMGISAEHIEVAGFCTRCHPDLFFSVRHARGATGRFAAGLMLLSTKKRSPHDV